MTLTSTSGIVRLPSTTVPSSRNGPEDPVPPGDRVAPGWTGFWQAASARARLMATALRVVSECIGIGMTSVGAVHGFISARDRIAPASQARCLTKQESAGTDRSVRYDGLRAFSVDIVFTAHFQLARPLAQSLHLFGPTTRNSHHPRSGNGRQITVLYSASKPICPHEAWHWNLRPTELRNYSSTGVTAIRPRLIN